MSDVRISPALAIVSLLVAVFASCTSVNNNEEIIKLRGVVDYQDGEIYLLKKKLRPLTPRVLRLEAEFPEVLDRPLPSPSMTRLERFNQRHEDRADKVIDVYEKWLKDAKKATRTHGAIPPPPAL